MFENINLPTDFIDEVKKINNSFIEHQTMYINKTLEFIKSPEINQQKNEDYVDLWFDKYKVSRKRLKNIGILNKLKCH